MMVNSNFLAVSVLVFLALASPPAFVCGGSTPLQDFCVADTASNVFVNGFVCKNPMMVTPNDFYFRGLNFPGNTANPLGSAVTPVFVNQLPGLNTLGVALARLDLAPAGLVPLHYHPRATEVLTVLEGSLLVGFVTSAPNFRFFSKVLGVGDVFVFPQGLVHFQFNNGKRRAVALSGLGSENPGLVLVANAAFGATPDLPNLVLAKTFQLDPPTVDDLLHAF